MTLGIAGGRTSALVFRFTSVRFTEVGAVFDMAGKGLVSNDFEYPHYSLVSVKGTKYGH